MIITPAQAAEMLGVTERRIRQLVQQGDLKSEGKFGATVAVDRSSVVRLKAKRDGEAKNGNGNRKVGK